MRQTVSPGQYSEGSVLQVAFELGWKVWKLGMSSGLGQRIWRTSVVAGDLSGLRRALERGRKELGLPAKCGVISCYEAGRDGFWLHRLLSSWGISNLVVDSSSIEVKRRQRRAKTDGLDVIKLVTMLARWVAGEREVWSVVRVPSVEEEDGRHLHRELRTLKQERTRLVNRIKGLLASQGVRVGKGRGGVPGSLSGLRTWEGKPLPEGLEGRTRRELERYRFVHGQVLELEGQGKRQVREGRGVAVEQMRRLSRLRGIGLSGARVWVREFGWRQFRNRRQVGALSGLVPTPYQSGESVKERGISRAGNRHVRGVAVDLAWGWLRHQPGSELACWYRRRFAQGGSRIRKIGIVALARKLLIALWRYSAFGEVPRGALLKPLSI
jgi:transposase